MADESLKDFVVSVSVDSDASSAAKAEALVKRTEERLTATTQAESTKRATAEESALERVRRASVEYLARRRAAEEKADQERLDRAWKTMGIMLGLDEEQSEALAKQQKENAGRSVKTEQDTAKKTTAIRTEQFKDIEAKLLRFTSVAQTVASGVSGILSAAPIGGFLVGVERTASAMSNLAIQSQRVGASASGIQRYLYAMTQSGVDEGEANGALEGFSKTVKSNPDGYKGLLESWGVKTTDDKGNDLSREEVLVNLGRSRLSKESLQQATLEANRLGISGDNAINALRHPDDLQRGYNAYDAKLRAFGLDPNKAAEDARKVEQAYGDLEADLKIVRTKVESEFFVPMMAGFDGIAKWMEAHPDVTKDLETGLVAFAGVLSLRVLPVVGKLLAAMTGLGSITLSPALLALLGVEGASYLANNTQSNVDPWAGQSAGETALRALDPGLADRTYGKRGEQLPQGPHHGLGVHAAPHDTRTLWQKRPTWLGGAPAPEGVAPQGTPAERLRRAAQGPGARLRDRFRRSAGGADDNAYPSGPIDADKLNWSSMDRDRAAKRLVLAQYATSLGLPDAGAAGMVGHAEVESNFKTDAHNGRLEDSTGLFQLNDSARAGYRHSKYLAWARQNNRTPTDWKAQMDYGKYEAQHMQGPNGLTVWDAMQQAKTVGEANHIWMDHFENPSVKDYANRERFGQKAYAALQSHPRPLLAPSSASADRSPDGSLKLAARTLGRYIGVTRPMAAAGQMPHPHEIGPYHGVAKVEVVKSNLDPAHQKLADAMKASDERMKAAQQSIMRLHKEGKLDAAHLMRVHHLGASAGMLAALHASRIHNERHGDTFAIHTSDAKSGLDHAMKVSARRSAEDRVRNGQG